MHITMKTQKKKSIWKEAGKGCLFSNDHNDEDVEKEEYMKKKQVEREVWMWMFFF